MTAGVAAIRVANLSKRLEGDVPVTLVKDVSLEVYPGEFVAITGPSGSGKSSLLYLLGLLDHPTTGRIWVNGTDVTSFNEQALARLRMNTLGFVFQFHFLLPEFTALENVMLPMRKLGKFKSPKDRERAEMLLESVGLGDQMHKIPRKLSGGQSQRVAVARALANDPAIILADEPTGNLDSVSSENVQRILKQLAQEGRTVVAVTHDTSFAETADRIIHIVDGKIVS